MREQIFIPNIFQSEALKEIEKATLENEKAFVVVMPTGTGKTYLSAQWFKLQLEKNPKARLLFICHNQDILSQANDKEFENCLSEFDIPRGYYNKSEKNIGQVTFATVQTLAKNLDKLPSDYFDYIIVDEAHHYRAKSFEKTIKHFSPKVLLGLTATPYRMDGKSILDVFGRIIYNAPISSGIKSGLLSKIKYYYADNDIDFSKIQHDKRGKYKEKDLNKKLCVKEYDDAIIREYTQTVIKEHGKKKTICFCATVEHAYRMEKLFNENGIKAVTLTGKRFSESGKEVTVHDNKRKDIISKYKNGDYNIIFVRDLFNEGMDIPDADCIMQLRPTESSRIFTQQIGRGLRVAKGKDYLLVLDFTGNCYRCDINYEVLNKIMEIDIVKETMERTKNRNSSDIIIGNLGCQVILNKKKIDVINRSHENIITKDKLIENYFNMEKKLGRKPTTNDLQNRDISLYSATSYRNFFGSWGDFLYSIDNKYLRRNHEYTEKELIDNYLQVKEKLGRQPSEREMVISNGSLYGYGIYIRHFGSWAEFLSKVGDQTIHHRFVSEQDLIDNYYMVKKELCKVPTRLDLKSHGKYNILLYRKKFGSWKNFLLKIGEKKQITDDELIKNYKDLKNKFPDLILGKLSKKIGSRFSARDYINRFGSVANFLNKIGEEPTRNTFITETELTDNYFFVKNKLNRIPTVEEMNDHGKFNHATYVRRFGSWNNFLLSIGEKIRDRKRITTDELIQDYFDVKNKLNHIPTVEEIGKYGKFSDDTYYKRFGTWNKFLERIGEKINQYKSRKNEITEEELIENYLELKNKFPNLTSRMVNRKNGTKFALSTYYKMFGNWKKFLEIIGERLTKDDNNIVIISDYVPKNPLPNLDFKKSNKKSSIDTRSLTNYKYTDTINKDNIRQNIIGKIQDGDVVLMLESPELGALKEMDKQGKGPKKIIIPNHIEFNNIVRALKQYKTDLNIEVVNTSALQYIIDHSEEHFDFLWLDYCGGFSYYARDLEIVFQREIRDMKLVLTYNIFDPKKQDSSYYFTNVISYVLKKLRGKNEILLMEDISQRYKKTMFSLGFDIKNKSSY